MVTDSLNAVCHVGPLSKYKNWKISRKRNMEDQTYGTVFVHRTHNQTMVFQLEKRMPKDVTEVYKNQ